jgi:hypothetical protein
MSCPGSMPLTVGAPRSSSKYAAWGTVAHDIAAKHLGDGLDPSSFIGRVIDCDGHSIEVDQDMVDCVNAYAEVVREYQGDGLLLVEQQVNYAGYLGLDVSLAWGTADAVIARGDELIVIDLKTGMGVEVSAERNPQMSLYALGALAACNGVVGDFVRVRMVISQPRIRNAPSEWDCSVEDLETWARGEARSAANSVLLATEMHAAQHAGFASTFLRPSESGCKFCSAKATCPALRDEVHQTVNSVRGAPASPDEFAFEVVVPEAEDTAAWLSACLSKVDLIEDWCKAVRAEVERRLLAGDNVPGYKLVQGKRGSRQWTDATAAEAMLKTFRLKQEEMYEFKLISPTTAEKLAKAETIGKRQWPKLQDLITQREGAPHVAPASDSRPALVVTPVVDDFADVTPNALA